MEDSYGKAMTSQSPRTRAREWCQQVLKQPGYPRMAEVAEEFLSMERDLEASQRQVERLRAALELVAAPKRSDGTYNRCREACEELARDALRTLEGGEK